MCLWHAIDITHTYHTFVFVSSECNVYIDSAKADDVNASRLCGHIHEMACNHSAESPALRQDILVHFDRSVTCCYYP